MFSKLTQLIETIRNLKLVGGLPSSQKFAQELVRLKNDGISPESVYALIASTRTEADAKILSNFIYGLRQMSLEPSTTINYQSIESELTFLFQQNFFSTTLEEFLYRNWNYYSQEGEDLILSRVLPGDSGFYVDVGAHHPYRFSNTNYFYRKGWSGINVEPSPIGFDLLRRARPRDINLNVGVANLKSGSPSEMTLYRFTEEALNTIDLHQYQAQIAKGAVKKDEVKISVQSLESILEEHAVSKEIDFLTVDCEGVDLEVLQSNNWDRWRPKFIVTELMRAGKSSEGLNSDPIYQFLNFVGYAPFSRLYNSCIFERL